MRTFVWSYDNLDLLTVQIVFDQVGVIIDLTIQDNFPKMIMQTLRSSTTNFILSIVDNVLKVMTQNIVHRLNIGCYST